MSEACPVETSPGNSRKNSHDRLTMRRQTVTFENKISIKNENEKEQDPLRKLSIRTRRNGGLGPIEMAYIERKLPSKKIKRAQKIRLAKRSITLGFTLAVMVLPGFFVGVSAYTGVLFGGAVTEELEFGGGMMIEKNDDRKKKILKKK